MLRAHMLTLSLLPVCSTGFVMLQGIGRNLDAAILGSGRQGLFLVPLILIDRIYACNDYKKINTAALVVGGTAAGSLIAGGNTANGSVDITIQGGSIQTGRLQ